MTKYRLSAEAGQLKRVRAYFSAQIMKRFRPKSIKTVAICGQPDPEMEALCRENKIEVVVIPEREK